MRFERQNALEKRIIFPIPLQKILLGHLACKFTQNTQNLRKFSTPKFWVVNPSLNANAECCFIINDVKVLIRRV